jgi:hypothetical protein
MKHIFLTIALTLLLANPLTAETITFQPKLGSERTQAQTVTMTMGIDAGGQAMNIDMEVFQCMHFTVASITDSLIDLEARYDSMAVKVEMPNFSQRHSTGQSDPGNLMNSMLEALKDKPFNIILTKSGKIHAIKNLEAIMAAVDKLAEQADPQQGQMFKQQIQGQFGEEAIKEGMFALSVIFPEKPINKGESWQTTSTRTTGNLPIKEMSTHTLTDVTDTQYVIETVSDVQQNPDAQGASMGQGPAPKMNIKGTDSRITTLDKATGWLVSSKGETSLDAGLDESDPNAGGMGFKMTVKASNVLTGK